MSQIKHMSNYKKAQEKFSIAQFDETVTLIDQALVEKTSDDHTKLLALKADSLFELGKVQEAQKIYQEISYFPHAAFAALLQKNIDEAILLYKQADFSPSKKWGIFLCEFLLNPHHAIVPPGFFSARLFFDATYAKFQNHGLDEYIQIIKDNIEQLEAFHPGIRRDIKNLSS